MKSLLALFLMASASAATISTITCTSGVATVTVANTLIANQGFEITGSSVSSYNINGTAVSANSTSFTFKTACNGPATGGTFSPAWQVINNGITGNTNGTITINYIFWLTTSTPLACSTCVSSYSNITASQLVAIQAGTTVEVTGSLTFSNTAGSTNMNNSILNLYASDQASLNTGLTPYIGWCYNGSWSAPPCN